MQVSTEKLLIDIIESKQRINQNHELYDLLMNANKARKEYNKLTGKHYSLTDYLKIGLSE